MTPTRREILAAGLAAVAAPGAVGARERGPGTLGLVIHSFPVRNSVDRDRRPEDRFADPIRFLDHARSLGARGVSYAQSIDTRIKAIVAWDNLASDLNGDKGSASGGPPLGNLIGDVKTEAAAFLRGSR